ncbi:MAG TPA: EamA family transporter [Gemmatimonadaceae bacterium]|jgi:drug/metabolite transporter (DMT)-like permease|nr:EamA family transporter [Gemmatimonadaceae bacterium]
MTSAGLSGALPRPSSLALGAAFGAVYLFWGVTFLAIRYAVLDGVPPLIVISVRCLFGAAILYAWLAAHGNWEPTSLAQWRTAGVAGVFLFVGGHSAMAWAEQWVDSGETALLMTTIPLWLVVLTAGMQRRAPSRRVMAGLGLGMAGVAVLAFDAATWNGNTLPRVVLLVCALAWAAGSIVARDGARPASAVQSTTMQLAVGAVVVTLLALVTGDLGRWDPSALTPRAAWALAFLVIGGTVLGFAAYTWLLQVTTPAAVGTYAFVNPVVAVALAAAMGDMAITLGTAAAAVLVLSSVALTRPLGGSTSGRPARRGPEVHAKSPNVEAGEQPGVARRRLQRRDRVPIQWVDRVARVVVIAAPASLLAGSMR